MDLGRLRIAEKRVVATHVVIINRLSEKRDRTFQEKLFRLQRFAEFVQTKAGVKKSRSAMRRHAAKPPANPQGAGPFFLSHQMMEPQLQNFWSILLCLFDRVQFSNRLPVHA